MEGLGGAGFEGGGIPAGGGGWEGGGLLAGGFMDGGFGGMGGIGGAMPDLGGVLPENYRSTWRRPGCFWQRCWWHYIGMTDYLVIAEVLRN